MKKRYLLLTVLLVAVCVAMLAMPAAAAEAVETGGTCGAGLIWTIEGSTLTVSGNGQMNNYSKDNAPWKDSRETITKIVIGDSVTSIGNWAFYGCINVTDVQIGSGVVSIGHNAFNTCTALTEIVIPDNVATMGEDMLQGTSLSKVTVPFVGRSMTSTDSFAYIFNGILETLREVVITKDTTIPGAAFKNWTLLEQVTLPAGIESIGNETFYGCTALTKVHMGWESLTGIGNHAFYNCVALMNVGCGDYVISIPETVRTLGNYTFAGCRCFTAVNVDLSGTIGEGAFDGCTGVTSITIGDEVTTINAYAFRNTMITTVTVPDNVTAIGKGAFQGCPMVSITVPFVGNTAEMTGWTGTFGYIFGNTTIWKGGETLTSDNVEYTSLEFWSSSDRIYVYIPETLRHVTITQDTTIPSCAFNNCDLIETVTLPENVEWIDSNAFRNCTALQSVDMGWENIVTIGNNAFRNCSSLVRIGDVEKVISIPANVTTLGTYAFAGCTQFTTVTVDMAGAIGEGAFDGCTAVTSVTIGDQVTTINAYAFRNTMITTVTVPDNVTAIGKGAFQGCPMVSITVPFVGNTAEMTGWTGTFGYIFGNTTIWKGGETRTSDNVDYTSLEIWDGNYRIYVYVPETLRHVTITQDTTIPQSAFNNCDLIETITLPENVEWIDHNAFRNCTALQSVDMGWENISSIGNSAFRNCTSLIRVGDVEKTISIPSNVVTLGTYAFAGCTQLTTVTVDMAGTIGEGAFDACTGVTGITIGDEVTGIGHYAFRNTKITGIVVPDSVTSMGTKVFEGCPMVSMTIPFIGDKIDGTNTFGYIFNGVPATLKHVTVTMDTTIPASAFKNCKLIETVTLPQDVISIGNEAFRECIALKRVDMGWESLSTIGNSAFQNCTSLIRVGDTEKILSIPSTVTTLGTCAFSNCDQIETVIINMVGNIGQYAFEYCDKLTSVTISDGVSIIQYAAFYECKALGAVTLSGGVTHVGEKAFYHCTGLRHVLYKGTEEAWNAIRIDPDNDYLKWATRHYECSGNEVVDPVNNVCQICCTHVFAGQLQHADATCTEGSYDKKVCTICAYFEKLNETEPLGHEYTETKVPVTCTSQGYTLYECDQCGHSYIAGYTEVKGHNYNAVVTDPTCANAGYTTHTCIDCGHSYDDAIVEALGHSYQSVVTNPTCTAEGFTTYTCVTCGESYKADFLPTAGHSYNGTVTDPTCTAKGYTTFLCGVCGHSYKGEFVDKIAHDYSATVIEPTCTKGGYTSHVCVNCGDSYQSDQVAAPEHAYVTVTVAPTCTDNGYDRHTCADCGKSYDDAIVEATGHSYEATVSAPTCTEMGYTSYLCKVCGNNYYDDYLELSAHSFVETVVAPSCTAVGYTQKLCTACGEEVFGDYVEMVAHDYAATVIAPSCTAEGYTRYACSVCGEDYTADPVEMLAHDYAVTVIAPSCTAGGYTSYVCRGCGEAFTDTPVEATGHSFAEANCTAAKYCTVCGQTEGAALGHNDVVNVVAATCTTGGYTTHLCDRCGNSYTDSSTAPLGHSYVYSLLAAPTRAEAGSLLGECSMCDAEQTVTVPELNEVEYDCVVEKQPTYIEEGVMCYAWKNKQYGDFLFRVNIPVMEMTDATQVQIGNVHGNPGKTVDVVIRIQDAPVLKSIGIRGLVYDAEHLTLVSAQWLVEGKLGAWDEATGAGVLAFEESSYVNGEIMKLTFRVHEDAPEETYSISCEVVLKEAVSGVELELPLQLQQGSITVQNYAPGDVDGNGQVNTDDAIYLLYHVMFGEEDYPVNQGCDFDGNGQVNTDDAIYLLYHIMFEEEYYPLH